MRLVMRDLVHYCNENLKVHVIVFLINSLMIFFSEWPLREKRLPLGNSMIHKRLNEASRSVTGTEILIWGQLSVNWCVINNFSLDIKNIKKPMQTGIGFRLLSGWKPRNILCWHIWFVNLSVNMLIVCLAIMPQRLVLVCETYIL